tara:strand:+ start:342 stop:1784 length:1443 start_codon:yes stop_codon:yes gene_type:complete
MIEWGISAGTHDASITVVEGETNEILFASHSERFGRRNKNDGQLNHQLIKEAKKYGKPDRIYWYEDPLLKFGRKLYSGEPNKWLSPKKYLEGYGIKDVEIKWGNHHKSHAAAGFYTSPFKEAAVLVIDAIGEFETITIWHGKEKLKKIHSVKYPKSLGLFYSAMTDRIGLKANEDEYILMGMSAYGNPIHFYNRIKKDLLQANHNFHKGCRDWCPGLQEKDYFHVAAATQSLYEEEFKKLLKLTWDLTKSKNIVLMGGCALNCLANRHASNYFDNSWIMPNPGDAGSSLGAIAAYKEEKLQWKTPYLGYDIAGKYPVTKLLNELLTNHMVGVANGRAEFGPRALGNRSLLADPRGQEMKDLVNSIKKRQEFRPFAPVILESDVHKYFDVPRGFKSPYMQYVVKCRDTKSYPAIVHEDGTSRVQTVSKEDHRGLYNLLTKWKEETGCPMLLNTSLNIKGQPIVNTSKDADRFANKYNVKCF